MQIKFEVNWQIQLSRNLRLVAINLKNLKPFFEKSLDIIKERTDEVFEKEWSNVEKNPKWRKLTPRVEKARIKRWWYYKKTPNNPWILRWTWNLQENITKEATNKNWVLIYNAPYAIYHQNWWLNLPKRAIIDLSNKVNDKIIKTLQMKINNDIKIFGKQL